jgi:hypothetical protein
MPHWPLGLHGGGPIENAGSVPATSRGTLVTAAATTHTKGAWVQLIAATSREATWIEIELARTSSLHDYLVDIGIGAAGSEQVLLADLTAGSGSGSVQRGGMCVVHLAIPAASRLSARCQASTASASMDVVVTLGSGGMITESGTHRVTTYGATTATSQGTAIDPGTTAHTKGAWTQITAATTQPIRAVLLGQSNQLQNTRTSCSWLLDLGVGASGSEVVILPDLHYECSSTEDTILPALRGPYYLDIPAGTALSARCQCSITTATVRLMSTIVYGIG